MSKIPSIGFNRPIPLWTALVFFAVAAGYVCENRLVQNRISSLSLDQENLRYALKLPTSHLQYLHFFMKKRVTFWRTASVLYLSSRSNLLIPLVIAMTLICSGLRAQDYTITTTAGSLIITDNSNNSDNLSMIQNGANIRFTMVNTALTYSINGGAVTAFTTPADVALSGLTSITVHAAGGNDIINTGAFTADLPSLTINGGTGNDDVNLNGDINFVSNANLDLDLQNDDATPGVDDVIVGTNANILLSGSGTVTLKTSRSVYMSGGGSIETVNGDLIVETNQQATATTGNFTGVYMPGAGGKFMCSGTGSLTIKGRGGNTGTCYGVLLQSGANIQGGTGTVSVTGRGGAAASVSNRGVSISGASSKITSTGGDVSVSGTGGGTGTNSDQHGVYVSTGGQISAGGNGNVSVVGQAGNGGTNFNHGVYVESNAPGITSSGGNVSVTGTGQMSGTNGQNFGVQVGLSGIISAGGSGTVTVTGTGGSTSGGTNIGVILSNSAKITSSGGHITVIGTEGSGTNAFGIVTETTTGITTSANGGNITLIANSMDLLSSTSASTQTGNSVTLRPRISGVQINVGTATNSVAGPLGLSDAELDRITTGTLIIGDANSGVLTVSAAISRPASTNVQLVSGDDVVISGGGFNTSGGTMLLDAGASPKAVKPTFNSTDVTASTLSFASNLAIVINGTTPGNGTGSTYTQLNVAGALNLTGVDLILSGSHTAINCNTFTIVVNDGTDAVTGAFTGLPEGAIINTGPFATNNGIISYVGGTGNDVVITVVSPEINVQGNAVTIVDGDNSPSATDHTDFGTTTGAPITRTFTIQNTGNAALSLGTGSITLTGANASLFSISNITLPTSVSGPGGSVTFDVTYTPVGVAIHTATVNIANNDCNEGVYDFALLAERFCVAPSFPTCPSPSVPANTAPGFCNAVVWYTVDA
ncbi:MAG TPA: choice-of-anchor D domain-containing protein, partial [Saprospiraceae bacterium]|nr:choice-of-anchor D domain-containing protein [Saprospiraceae bacterium]